MPTIRPELEAILKKYHDSPKDAVWLCQHTNQKTGETHSVWVAYHKDLEAIARKAKIRFDPPQIIEADGLNKVAAVCVVGRMDGSCGSLQFSNMEWSIGEAAPHNNKNEYPFAMAEKRAKDRVILKLLGIHGEVYSEEEADDFKPKGKDDDLWGGPLTKTKLKEAARDFHSALVVCKTVRDVEELESTNKAMLDQMRQDMPAWYEGVPGSEVKGLGDRIGEKMGELSRLEELEAPR